MYIFIFSLCSVPAPRMTVWESSSASWLQQPLSLPWGERHDGPGSTHHQAGTAGGRLGQHGDQPADQALPGHHQLHQQGQEGFDQGDCSLSNNTLIISPWFIIPRVGPQFQIKYSLQRQEEQSAEFYWGCSLQVQNLNINGSHHWHSHISHSNYLQILSLRSGLSDQLQVCY